MEGICESCERRVVRVARVCVGRYRAERHEQGVGAIAIKCEWTGRWTGVHAGCGQTVVCEGYHEALSNRTESERVVGTAVVRTSGSRIVV